MVEDFSSIIKCPKGSSQLASIIFRWTKRQIVLYFSSNNEKKIKLKINKSLKTQKFLNGKSLSFIKNAQKNALIKTFKKNSISFRNL